MRLRLPYQLPFFFAAAGLLFFTACAHRAEPEATATTPSLSWQLQQSEVQASFRGLYAVDAQTCWLGGSQGTILRTTDGGLTWLRTAVPPGADSLDFRDIHAFSATEALAMSAGPGAQSRIYRTADGGASWVLVQQNQFPAGFYNAMSFWDDRRGILAGDAIEGQLFLLTTTDGGRSWQRLFPRQMPELDPEEHSFAASGTHITTLGDSLVWIGTGGRQARIFASDDAGRSWTVAATPIRQGAPSQGIFSLLFADTAKGLAIGGDYAAPLERGDNVLLTADGGRTWRLAQGPFPEYRSCLAFLPGGWILAVGRTGTDLSFGGESWQKADTTGFYTAACAGSPPACWAAGPQGRVARLEYSLPAGR